MLTRETNLNHSLALHRHLSLRQPPVNSLCLVTAHELKDLADALTRGLVPRDFETKLRKLAAGDLIQRSIEQNCRKMISLLQAAQQGCFKRASSTDCEQLLRVLAYVRKDDDAIADYRSDGFIDDHRETRAVTKEMASLLESFKAWRLRHQVPAMWA